MTAPKTQDVDYYMSLPYTIELIPDPENSGEWYARIPLLKGLLTDGSSIPEALEMLEDAKYGWLCVALENGLDIPEPDPEADLMR